jgi:hypothetical protein
MLFGVLFFFGYAFSALLRFQGHPGVLRGPVPMVFDGLTWSLLSPGFGVWDDEACR